MAGNNPYRRARLLPALALAALLVLLLVSTALAAAPKVAYQVHIGGPDYCAGAGSQPGCDANFSTVAFQ